MPLAPHVENMRLIRLSFSSGTALWLWLGVLDAIQGVGLGMILLQTLSRLHVCATLALAQVIGSAVVMIARATAPDKVGPGNVFPNFALWDNSFSPSMNPLTVSTSRQTSLIASF